MTGMIGARSNYGGGKGGLTANPYQTDTRVDDVRGFGGFGTNRPVAPARVQQRALLSNDNKSTVLGGPDLDDKLKELTLRQARAAAEVAEAKARAMTMGAPTKELHGFNLAGRVMDDPENLTGAQREVFLPDNATIVDAGSSGPTAHLSPDAPAKPEATDPGSAMRTWLQMQALQRRA